MSARWWAWLVLMMTVVGCRPALPTSPRAALKTPAFAPAERLPADAVGYVVAPNLEELWRRAQGARLVAAVRSDATRWFYRAERQVGVTPQPGALEALGVNVKGPAGLVALLDEQNAPVPVVFLTLAEPARFEAALHRFAAREGHGSPGSEGEAVLVGGAGAVWLLRGDMAYLVPREAVAVQRRLATFSNPEASLAARPAFRRAMVGQLQRKTAVAGFVDVRAFLYVAAGLDPRFGGADLEAARLELEQRHRAALAAATKERASLRELAAIDTRYRQWRQGLREDDTASELRALWGEVEGAGFRVEVRARRARLVARIVMPESAPLATLLGRKRPARTPLKSLTAMPYAAFELTAEPKALRQHLRALAPFFFGFGAGEPTADAKPLDALDGTATVVVTNDGTQPRVGARLGVRDGAAARALLERIGRDGAMHADGDDFLFGVGGVPPVRIGLRGQALVASSHRALFDALRTPVPASASYGGDSHVARVLRRSEAPLVMGGALAALVAGPVPPSVMPLPALEPEEPSHGDRDRVEAQLRRIEHELKVIDRSRRRRWVKLRRQWADALGQVAMAVAWERSAVRVDVRWERRDGLLVSALAKLMAGVPRRDDPTFVTDDLDAMRAQLNAKRFELLGRLQELEGASPPPRER